MKHRFCSLIPVLTISLFYCECLELEAALTEENFDYSAGSPLAGLNGGSGWGGAWTGSSTASIGSPGLDFPSTSEIGNKAILGSDGSTYTNFRQLPGSIDESNASSATFSFLFNLTGNDAETGIRFAGLSLFDGNTEQFFLGKPGNTLEVGYHKFAGGESINGVDSTFNSTTIFRFAATITFNPLGDETMTLTLMDNSGTVNTTWSDLNLGSSFGFDRIRLIRDFALDFDIIAEFDEIRIDAVPEPTAAGLVAAFCAAALCFPRHRRKQCER